MNFLMSLGKDKPVQSGIGSDGLDGKDKPVMMKSQILIYGIIAILVIGIILVVIGIVMARRRKNKLPRDYLTSQ